MKLSPKMKKALNVEADKFSSSAQKKIEAAGGQTITLDPLGEDQSKDKPVKKNNSADSD